MALGELGSVLLDCSDVPPNGISDLNLYMSLVFQVSARPDRKVGSSVGFLSCR